MQIVRQVSFPLKTVIACQRKRGKTGWIQQHNRKENLNLQKQKELNKKRVEVKSEVTSHLTAV